MKKINFKLILNVTLWVLGIAGLVSCLAFVNATERNIKGKTVTVTIEQDDDNSFIDEDDILKFLKDRNDTLINQSMKDINVYKLEKALNTHPSIASSEVAVTVSGDININIKQRKPAVRIINTHGESFYIDNKATIMPLADHYTARVLVVNGFIPEKYSQLYNYSIPQIEMDSAFKAITVIDDIYEVANYIKNDTLLNSLITQAYINKEREIELYPAIGNQKILFGTGTDIADKFEKLKIFYTQGLNSVNGWDRYSTINLKYKNQVVCIKKETAEKKIKPVVVPVVADEMKEDTEKKEKITEDKAETKKPTSSEEKKENKKSSETEKKEKVNDKETKTKEKSDSKSSESKKKKSESSNKIDNKKEEIKNK